MIKKAYLYIFSLASAAFGLASLVLSLAIYSSMSIDFGEVIVWAQDSVLHYNSNLNAGGHVIFLLVLAVISFLAFVIMLPILIKKRNYILIIFIIIYIISVFFGLIPILNFIYLDFNIGHKGLGIIDIDIFAMILGVFTVVFSIGTYVMVTLNMQKTTFKYDPVVIHKYKN